MKFLRYSVFRLGFLLSDLRFSLVGLRLVTSVTNAFRYYAYALQATGENDRAELAMRRAKTLDPRLDQ